MRGGSQQSGRHAPPSRVPLTSSLLRSVVSLTDLDGVILDCIEDRVRAKEDPVTATKKRLIGALLGVVVTSFGIFGCGGSTESQRTQLPNPVPGVVALSPVNASPGGPDFTLTVTGSNFVSNAQVRWNGSSRPTTFVSSSQVTASISASGIAAPGTVAVTVFNPPPGGGSSEPLTFAIEPNTATLWQVTELAFDTQMSYSNPFTDAGLTCEFDGPNGERLTISGFYDGSGVWRVRFTPTASSSWSYQTTSNNAQDGGLHGISGQLNVTPSQSSNPLYMHGGFLHTSANGKYLTYTDGTPFFWLGDTWWWAPSSVLPIDGENPPFKTLVDKRKEQQFSVVQMLFVGNNGDTYGPMVDSALNRRLDPSYWQLADRYFSYVNDSGLVPVIGVGFGDLLDSATLDDWEFLWSYVVARYGAYAISWLVCGEYNEFNVPSRVEKALALGQFIKDVDPYKRAMSIHPWWYGGDQHQAWSQPWYDFIMIQGGHLAPPSVPPAWVYSTAYALNPPKPVVQTELDYEGIYGGTANEIMPAQVRRVAYQAIQMGVYGYTYGANGLWWTPSDQTTWPDWPWGIWPPWSEALNWPGAEQMQILRNLYESVEWWKLEPRSEALVLLGANPPDDPWKPSAKGDGDNLYIVYFPEGADPSAVYELHLKAAAEQNFNAKWFDPQTGTTTPLSGFVSCAAGACPLPMRPNNEDWALVLTAAQ